MSQIQFFGGNPVNAYGRGSGWATKAAVLIGLGSLGTVFKHLLYNAALSLISSQAGDAVASVGQSVYNGYQYLYGNKVEQAAKQLTKGIQKMAVVQKSVNSNNPNKQNVTNQQINRIEKISAKVQHQHNKHQYDHSVAKDIIRNQTQYITNQVLKDNPQMQKNLNNVVTTTINNIPEPYQFYGPQRQQYYAQFPQLYRQAQQQSVFKPAVDAVKNWASSNYNTLTAPVDSLFAISNSVGDTGKGLMQAASGEEGSFTSGMGKVLRGGLSTIANTLQFGGSTLAALATAFPWLALLAGTYYTGKKIFGSKPYQQFKKLKQQNKLDAGAIFNIAGEGAIGALGEMGNIARYTGSGIKAAKGYIGDMGLIRGVTSNTAIASSAIGNSLYDLTGKATRGLWTKVGVKPSVWARTQKRDIDARLRQLEQKKKLNNTIIQKKKKALGTELYSTFPQQFQLEAADRTIQLAIDDLNAQLQQVKAYELSALQQERNDEQMKALQKKKQMQLKKMEKLQQIAILQQAKRQSVLEQKKKLQNAASKSMIYNPSFNPPINRALAGEQIIISKPGKKRKYSA